MGTSDTQRFGPYIILDRVGDGGMAEIFLAKMTGYSGFEKLIALKKILPRFSRDPAFAQLLIHEAKLAASLIHFNIVQVLDLGEIDGQVYIAMEYVRGRDLAAVLSAAYRKKERLPLGLSLFIATEFITGLDYAHRMMDADGHPLSIIHRDISPQNVLVSFEGEVKVTDFGIARALSEKDGPKQPNDLLGKFGYMSPELLRGQKIDQRSDVFSAGVVLYEMLTGARLFRGKNQDETVKMILAGNYPKPSAINPDVPPSVDRIVAKALEQDLSERYQTTGAFLGDLCQISDALPRRTTSRDLSVFMRRTYGETANQTKVGRPRGDSKIQYAAPANPPRAGDRILLGEILVNQGAITPTDLEIALAEQRARGGRIGNILILAGLITEDALIRALSLQSGLTTLTEEDLRSHPPPRDLLRRLPVDLAKNKLIAPISANDGDGSVRLVVADPYDDRSIQSAKAALGAKSIVCFLTKPTVLTAILEDWYDEDEPVEAREERNTPVFRESSNERPIVLFADGDLASIEPLVLRIREEDCEVMIVEDGRRAKTAFEGREPAVALLDAALPRIDGYNLLLDLRAAGSEAAIFITSTRGDDARQAKALELGADDFLVKPFSLDLCTSKIRRELQKRARRAARSASVSGASVERTPTPAPWMASPAPFTPSLPSPPELAPTISSLPPSEPLAPPAQDRREAPPAPEPPRAIAAPTTSTVQPSAIVETVRFDGPPSEDQLGYPPIPAASLASKMAFEASLRRVTVAPPAPQISLDVPFLPPEEAVHVIEDGSELILPEDPDEPQSYDTMPSIPEPSFVRALASETPARSTSDGATSSSPPPKLDPPSAAEVKHPTLSRFSVTEGPDDDPIEHITEGTDTVFAVLSDDLFLSTKPKQVVERVENSVADPASRGKE